MSAVCLVERKIPQVFGARQLENSESSNWVNLFVCKLQVTLHRPVMTVFIELCYLSLSEKFLIHSYESKAKLMDDLVKRFLSIPAFELRESGHVSSNCFTVSLEQLCDIYCSFDLLFRQILIGQCCHFSWSFLILHFTKTSRNPLKRKPSVVLCTHTHSNSTCNANTTVNNMIVFIFKRSEVKDDFDWFAYLTEGEEDYVPPLDDSDSVIYCVSYSNL